LCRGYEDLPHQLSRSPAGIAGGPERAVGDDLVYHCALNKFACKWLRTTDRVLEVGCEEGFGTHFFSKHSAHATGLNIDSELIEGCRGKYVRYNLEFVVGDIVRPEKLPRPEYDAVVRFEMLEHISLEQGAAMVARCALYLNSGWILIMSTPCARPDRSVSHQQMHVYEYDYDTLVAMLSPHFSRMMVFCQNDEYIYAGHPATGWNYVALGFKP